MIYSSALPQTEHLLQKAIADYLNAVLPNDCIWFAVPNGGQRNARVGAKLKAEGVKPGAPDIVLVFRGQPYGLEVKTLSGTLSKPQKAFHEGAARAGMNCFVVRSVDDVERVLRDLCVPIKGAISHNLEAIGG